MGCGESKHSVIMTGLDGVGKSSIAQQLEDIHQEQPVVEFPGRNLEILVLEKMQLRIWDGGLHPHSKERNQWAEHYQNCKGIVFVIDSGDSARLIRTDENAHVLITAQEELALLLSIPELETLPLLIFANKQDLEDAISSDEISVSLELENMNMRDRQWHIQPCSAETKQGLQEGINWLRSKLR
jgi:GTPase SAR1 family protein